MFKVDLYYDDSSVFDKVFLVNLSSSKCFAFQFYETEAKFADKSLFMPVSLYLAPNVMSEQNTQIKFQMKGTITNVFEHIHFKKIAQTEEFLFCHPLPHSEMCKIFLKRMITHRNTFLCYTRNTQSRDSAKKEECFKMAHQTEYKKFIPVLGKYFIFDGFVLKLSERTLPGERKNLRIEILRFLSKLLHYRNMEKDIVLVNAKKSEQFCQHSAKENRESCLKQARTFGQAWSASQGKLLSNNFDQGAMDVNVLAKMTTPVHSNTFQLGVWLMDHTHSWIDILIHKHQKPVQPGSLHSGLLDLYLTEKLEVYNETIRPQTTSKAQTLGTVLLIQNTMTPTQTNKSEQMLNIRIRSNKNRHLGYHLDWTKRVPLSQLNENNYISLAEPKLDFVEIYTSSNVSKTGTELSPAHVFAEHHLVGRSVRKMGAFFQNPSSTRFSGILLQFLFHVYRMPQLFFRFLESQQKTFALHTVQKGH